MVVEIRAASKMSYCIRRRGFERWRTCTADWPCYRYMSGRRRSLSPTFESPAPNATGILETVRVSLTISIEPQINFPCAN